MKNIFKPSLFLLVVAGLLIVTTMTPIQTGATTYKNSSHGSYCPISVLSQPDTLTKLRMEIDALRQAMTEQRRELQLQRQKLRETMAKINHIQAQTKRKERILHIETYTDTLNQDNEQNIRYKIELETDALADELQHFEFELPDFSNLIDSIQEEFYSTPQRKNLQQEMETYRQKMRKAREEYREAMKAYYNEKRQHLRKMTEPRTSLGKILQQELVKDNLIKSNEGYTLKINKEKLYINETRQDDDHYKKYRQLIEETQEIKVDGSITIQYSHH